MKVFVASMKKNPFPLKEGYYNLQMGASQSKEKIFENRDNTGDNISKKNPFFCEMTGLYWMWKNVDEEIIGLTHYRRYFYNHIFSSKYNIISEEKVNKILKKYDIILPQPGYLFKSNVYKQFVGGYETHDINDLVIIENIIKEKYPDYSDSFNKVMNSKKWYPFCMFIAKNEIISNYANWLFDILDEYEKVVDLSKKDEKYRRTPAFISERLFNVWLDNNNLKIKDKPVYNIEKPIFKQKIIAFIKWCFRGVMK